jgi:DNA-binding NarL/FixJ family response regulator
VLPIRVLAVDDHRLMLEGVLRILRSETDVMVVGGALSGEEAIRLFEEHRPDVVLMDLELRGMSGVETIQALRTRDASARIIVLTMYSGPDDIFRAIQAGAAAYILKDAIPEDLIATIRAVHGGRHSLSPDIEAVFNARRHQQTLTAREIEVLTLLVDGKRDKEIADELQISFRTVQAHIRSIFEKLGVDDRTAAVSTAVRRGIIRLHT